MRSDINMVNLYAFVASDFSRAFLANLTQNFENKIAKRTHFLSFYFFFTFFLPIC